MARQVRRSGPSMGSGSRLVTWGLGCGVLLVGGLIAVAFMYKGMLAEPPAPPEAKLAPPAATVATTPPLKQQVEQVKQAAATGQPQTVRLQLSPADMEELMQGSSGRGFSDGRAYFGDGVVVVQGKVQQGGKRLGITLRMKPSVEGGNLKLEVTEAKVGTFPMPRKAREEVEQQIGKALRAHPPQQAGVTLTGVTVSPSGMVLDGKTGGG